MKSVYFDFCQEEKYVYNDSLHCWEMQRCCFLSDHCSVLGCNFPKSYFVLITGSNSKPMRLGSVGVVLVFTPCEFDSTITATPLSKCISPKNERLNVILEYSRGKTEFINIFCRNTLQTYIYCRVLDIILALRSSNNMPFYYTENVSWWDKSTIHFL